MEIKIRIDGAEHKAQAQLIKGILWVHYKGRVFTVDTGSSTKARRKKSGVGSSNQVTAPMPGKVTKILLSAGDPVAAGQAVLVMEAMKMEYTLKSEIAGVVDSISCQVNEQVALGKSLVNIKPELKS